MEEKYINYFTEIEANDKKQKKYLNRAIMSLIIIVVISRFSETLKPLIGNVFYLFILIPSLYLFHNFYEGSELKPTTKEMLFHEIYIIKANLEEYMGHIEDKRFIKRVFKSLNELSWHFSVQTNTGFDIDFKIEDAINTFYENIPHYRKDLEENPSQDNLRKYSSFFSNALNYLYDEDIDKFSTLVKKNHMEKEKIGIQAINWINISFPSLGGYVIVSIIILILSYFVYSYFNLSLSTEVDSLLTTITIMGSIIYFVKIKIYDRIITARTIPRR